MIFPLKMTMFLLFKDHDFSFKYDSVFCCFKDYNFPLKMIFFLLLKDHGFSLKDDYIFVV